MKKQNKWLISLVLLLSATLFLSGCSDDKNTKNISGSTSKTKQVESKQEEFIQEKLPQSLFDGIPFPGSKEQAKLAGFTDCSPYDETNSRMVQDNHVGYKCYINRKVKYEGYEFESAYVLLNKFNNYVNYNSQGKQLSVNRLPLLNEYSYRTIHLITKNEVESSCNKEAGVKSFYCISSGREFLIGLESKGWLRRCDERGGVDCASYSIQGSYKIFEASRGFDNLGVYQMHLTLEHLSPGYYGVDYQSLYDEKKLADQKISKDKAFLDSMKE